MENDPDRGGRRGGIFAVRAIISGGWAYCPGCRRKVCRLLPGARAEGLEFKCRSCGSVFGVETPAGV